MDQRLSEEEARAVLERMREIRTRLEEDDSPHRRLRIKQADRRIRTLEARLGEEAASSGGGPGEERSA